MYWYVVSIEFLCMYWHVWWYVYGTTYWYVSTWHVLVTVCIIFGTNVCITCIGITGMYSQVISAGIDMYWLVLACMKKWYVLYALVCICTYLHVLLCIDLYWIYDMHWYVWYVLVCICMYW